jgi:hypothetical protein
LLKCSKNIDTWKGQVYDKLDARVFTEKPFDLRKHAGNANKNSCIYMVHFAKR